MAPPPTKKAKTETSGTVDLTEHDSKPPIIFKPLGKEPDVCFHVFSQDFYVYSGALTINSEFFEKKFESSQEDTRDSLFLPKIRSEWFTEIDAENRSWSLSPDVKHRDADLSNFLGSVQDQEEGFGNLLCAIFNRGYHITSCAVLDVMPTHAKIYRVLPIVSNSLLGPLYTSEGFIDNIRAHPVAALCCAYHLRHKQLFNDSLVYFIGRGPWNESPPRYTQLKDPKLRQIAARAHSQMTNKLLSVQQGMFHIFAHNEEIGKDVVALAKRAKNDQGRVMSPRYFRLCHNKYKANEENAQFVKKLFGPILKSHLVMDKKAIAGQGDFAEYFLSLELETYPWDESEEHWVTLET